MGQLVVLLKDGRPYALEPSFAFAWLRDESGNDLTGEGNPDLVFELYSGGAHCCFSTIVYDLGDSPIQVLKTPYSEAWCEGYFEDLDDDGAAEFVTCSTSYYGFRDPDYFSCYNGPGVRVILKYDPARGCYVTASSRFRQFYEEDIVLDTERAENPKSGDRVKTKCGEQQMCDAALVALDYLFTDRQTEAYSEFKRLYECPDADETWKALFEDTIQSQLYAPGDAPKAIVREASHYMLELGTNCSPALPILFNRGLWFLEEQLCIPLEWVEMLLRDINLVAEGEKLQLVSDLDATERAIAVVDISTGLPVGTVLLDTASGFPGKVYRIGDKESEHWRLKSDFTWERVSR